MIFHENKNYRCDTPQCNYRGTQLLETATLDLEVSQDLLNETMTFIMRCYDGDWSHEVITFIITNKDVQWYLESVQAFELSSIRDTMNREKELFSTTDNNGVFKACQYFKKLELILDTILIEKEFVKKSSIFEVMLSGPKWNYMDAKLAFLTAYTSELFNIYKIDCSITGKIIDQTLKHEDVISDLKELRITKGYFIDCLLLKCDPLFCSPISNRSFHVLFSILGS